MFRSRRLVQLLTASLVVGVALLAPTLASADDEDAVKAAPKKTVAKKTVAKKTVAKKIVIKKRDAQSDPMQVMHEWLKSHIDTVTPEGKGLKDGLEAWFSAGQDAPLAGLRDAFRHSGWNAQKLDQWMVGHMMMGRMQQGMPGMVRSFTTHGRLPHGFTTPGAGWGQMGPFGRGARGFTPGHATWGGVHPGHGSRTHTSSRATVMWNDGTGWRQMELPAGAALGGMPFGSVPFGGMRGSHSHGMPGMSGRSQHGGMGHGLGGGQRSLRQEVNELRAAVESLKSMLSGMPRGAGHPHMGSVPHVGGWQGMPGMPGLPGRSGKAGQPGKAGAPSGMSLPQMLEALRKMQPGAGGGAPNADQLQQFLEMMKQLQGAGANIQVHGMPGGDAASFLEALRKMQPAAPAPAAPKRVRIKKAAPGKLEKIDEEVVIVK